MNMLAELAIVGSFAAVVLWFGIRQHFFSWAPETDWNRTIRLYHVVAGFALYFAVSTLTPSIYTELLRPYFPLPGAFIGYATWLNFLLTATILSFLLILWSLLPRNVRNGIWRSKTATQPYVKDLLMGFYSWCLAFPIVLFVNQVLEDFLYQIVGIEHIPDQIAVRFVKMTAQYPFYFSLAIITVVIFAPLIEEFLFRGLLQSFIRKHIGSKQAILITALCFSFFHFSPEQGWGNLPIVASLFPLALFLGFLYERQRSLLASASLHSLFNLLSILNLYFMGGIPCA